MREKYSCDFETTTNPDDCRVWGFGYMNIYNFNDWGIGSSIDEFMKWCSVGYMDLYFHNLKFDGSFIVNWLLKNGFKWDKDAKTPKTFNTLISNMGQWYMLDICFGYNKSEKINVRIYDSLKKLPFSVDVIGKSFDLDVLKGEIDYHKERPVGHLITDEEKEYIKNDVEIVAKALREQFNEGLTKMTSGSDSLSGFKTIIKNTNFKRLFPVIDLEMDNNIRQSYRGGFTWLNEKYKGVDIGDGLVFDVNSLYPSQMYDKQLPYGQPKYFEGEYQYDPKYPLYVQHLQCSFEIKDNHIPTIQIKNGGMFAQNEYLHSSDFTTVDLHVTNIDLALIKEHYNLSRVKYINGYKFKSGAGFFKTFIDKWNEVKVTSTGAKRAIAKLMLNSLYGKFASNPDVTGKIPILRDDGSLGFVLGDEEFKDPVYTPMGIFITSWSRYLTITTAQKLYDRIIYCDTDSIHVVGTEIPSEIEDIIHDTKMGYWQHESTFTKARYLRQKTYIQEIDGKLQVTASGMNNTVKANVTWDNFHAGFQSTGSFKQKQVSGGVVLEDRPFKIY